MYRLDICVEFQRVPLKFHTKYLTHTLNGVDFIHSWKFNHELLDLRAHKSFWNAPPEIPAMHGCPLKPRNAWQTQFP